MQNQEIERKLISSNAHSSSKVFYSPSCFLKACLLKHKLVCVFMQYFIDVGVTHVL